MNSTGSPVSDTDYDDRAESPVTTAECTDGAASSTETAPARAADLALHPLAMITPDMSPDDYADLVADIKATALNELIEL